MYVYAYSIFDTCPGVDLNIESSLRVSRRDEEHLSQNISKYSFLAAAFDQIRICCHITIWNFFNSGDDWKWFDHNRRKVEMITRRLDTPFIPPITSFLSLSFTFTFFHFFSLWNKFVILIKSSPAFSTFTFYHFFKNDKLFDWLHIAELIQPPLCLEGWSDKSLGVSNPALVVVSTGESWNFPTSNFAAGTKLSESQILNN